MNRSPSAPTSRERGEEEGRSLAAPKFLFTNHVSSQLPAVPSAGPDSVTRRGDPWENFFVENLRGQKTTLRLVEGLPGPRSHSSEDPCSLSGPAPWGPLPRGQGKPEPLPRESPPRRREEILRRDCERGRRRAAQRH